MLSDLITLDFLAAWGSMCLVHRGMPVPEPSHGICTLLKKQSGFSWKVHDPTEYLKCAPPTLNAISGVLLYVTINPKVSIHFMFALKMPYRSILTAGFGRKPSSAWMASRLVSLQIHLSLIEIPRNTANLYVHGFSSEW